MDVHDNTVLNLWRTLNKHGVRYILIGGFAYLHGNHTITPIIEIYIEETIENRESLG